MANLAIIPARGGSKRIPRKNIREFLGKPVIAYSIEAAFASGLFDEVMVSTDDQEIAEIAERFGAKVPFERSEDTAGDHATTFDVIKEVTETYRKQFNTEFKYVCCLYATAPLITPGRLTEGLTTLIEGGFSTVFPVVAFSAPVWRGLRIKNGKTEMIWPEYRNTRSQDLPVVYHDAGQWYWLDLKKAPDSLYTENTSSLVLSEKEVQDIDNPDDWTLAEIKYRMLRG